MTPIGIQLKLGGEREVETGLRRVGGAMDTVGTAASALARAVGGVAGAFAGALSVREFVQAADAVTGLQNQLKLATGSAQAAGVAYNQLYEISQRSRTGFIELGKTFASISTAAADMGVSQQRLLKVTEAIGNAVTISGTGAQAAQAALQQLGQGLASGTLRGEELNSVMEQTPRLAKALADGLGVTRGELRALGQQGAITAEQVIKALESQSSVLQGEVKDATLTVGQAFTQLTNSATRAVGDFDKATGATATLAGTISSLAGAVDTLGGVIRNNEGAFKVLGGTLAGAAVVAGAAGIVKSIGLIGGAVAALGAVLLANPAVLALLGLSAAVGGGVALISAQSKTADGIGQAIERLRTENERSEAALARAVAGGRLAGADNIAKTIDARKDQIAKLRAELDSLQPASAGAGGGRGSVNPQTVGAAAAQQAAGEKELIAIRQKLYGVDKDYLPTLTKLHAQYTSGAISIDEYQKLVGKLAEANFKKEKADPGRGLKSEESAYQNLIATINTKIAQEREELAGAGALTESQRIRIKLDQDLAAGRVKLSAQNERAVRLALEELAASEASAEAAKTLAKANLDAAASREKYLTSLSTGLDKIQADIAAQIEATERMGLSKEAIAELDAAKLEMLATDLELQAIKAMDRNLDQQTYDALKKQAAAYRELGIAKKGGAAKEAALDLEKANAEAAKKAQEDWERASEQINSSLTDALLRGFESGKDFAKNLRDTVVNMFKTMVLRPVVSAIVSPISGALLGGMGLATAAQAGQGGASSGVSTALSGASLLGSVGGSLAAGAGWMTGATTLGGSLSAGMSLLGTGSLAGAGAGLGMLAGALGPIALGIGLLSSAFSRKLKDQGIEGTLGGEAGFEGQQYRFYKGGLFRSDKTKYSAIDPELERMLAGSFGAVQDRVTDFAEALSLPTDRIKGFTTDIKVSFKGLDEAGIQKALQDALATGSNELAQQVLGTWTSVTKEVTEVIQSGHWDSGLAAEKVTRTVTESTYAASEYAREGEKAIDTLTRLATSLGTVNDIWKNLGNTVYEASIAGADAASTMADAFGGLEAMAQATGAYFENFYSAEEQRAAVERQLNEALGKLNLQLPDIDATDARAQYRALAEAQDRNTEAGREAYVVLLQLSGAFASVTQAAGQAVDAASLERKDRLAAQRAQEKQAAEALQKQIEAYADGAEQFNTLRDSLLKAGDAAGLLAAVTERAFADPSGKYMNGKYELPRWEEGTTAAAYNYQYGVMQARMRQQLGDEASANALRIENVAGVLGAYSVEQMMSEYDSVTGPIKLAIQQGIVDASGDLSYAVRDAVQGAALYVAMADVRGQFTSNGPGLASIAAARASAADVGRSSYDYSTGLYRIGGASVEYGKALDNLKGSFGSGAITADVFERSVVALNEAMPGAAESVGTLEDLVAAVQGASYMVGQAGLNSIRYYFGSLSELTAEFAKAAGEAQEPIAQTTAAIGRLNSAQYAFAESASATLQGFGGGGVGGAWMLQDAGVMQDVTRAQLIAEAAGIASAAMTTADAAAVAVKLAQSPAFAELGAKGIRDAALLLDGVGEYNADGFERAFIRISDALAKGSVDEGQYKALFDTALDMFQGVPEETRTLIDSMTRLRDAMSGFADGLLIDEQRTTLSAGGTLAEMQRQYAQAFAGAATGDNDAIGKYQQLANTLLDKELYSTQAEYNAAFGSVYGDARQLEAIGVNTLANAQGSEMVNELKDMNAKLNKRVEDLEKNLMAALAQIAKNTSDTSRGIEQQIVMAEETP